MDMLICVGAKLITYLTSYFSWWHISAVSISYSDSHSRFFENNIDLAYLTRLPEFFEKLKESG